MSNWELMMIEVNKKERERLGGILCYKEDCKNRGEVNCWSCCNNQDNNYDDTTCNCYNSKEKQCCSTCKTGSSYSNVHSRV